MLRESTGDSTRASQRVARRRIERPALNHFSRGTSTRTTPGHYDWSGERAKSASIARAAGAGGLPRTLGAAYQRCRNESWKAWMSRSRKPSSPW